MSNDWNKYEKQRQVFFNTNAKISTIRDLHGDLSSFYSYVYGSLYVFPTSLISYEEFLTMAKV